MVRLLPMVQISPPLGDPTAMLPLPKVAFALLVSATVGSVRLVTRMRAWVVAGPVTVHACVPSLGVLPAIDVQEAPPSRDTSILTLPLSPLDVQARVWLLPTVHISPPFGDVTAMLPPPRVAFALLMSATVGVVRLVTRMRACAVAGPVTTQLWEPSFAVLPTTEAQDTPPSRETSIFTLPAIPLEVQVMVRVPPRGGLAPHRRHHAREEAPAPRDAFATSPPR